MQFVPGDSCRGWLFAVLNIKCCRNALGRWQGPIDATGVGGRGGGAPRDGGGGAGGAGSAATRSKLSPLSQSTIRSCSWPAAEGVFSRTRLGWTRLVHGSKTFTTHTTFPCTFILETRTWMHLFSVVFIGMSAVIPSEKSTGMASVGEAGHAFKELSRRGPSLEAQLGTKTRVASNRMVE